MNLCMTDLKGLGSKLFASPQTMVTTDLVKRTTPDFVVAAPPAKRPAPAPIQSPSAVPVSRAPSGPASSSASLTQLNQILSDPKRILDKQKQRQTLQQVIFFLKFQPFSMQNIYFLSISDFCVYVRLSISVKFVCTPFRIALISTTYKLFLLCRH